MSDYTHTYIHTSIGGPDMEISVFEETNGDVWIGPSTKGGIGSYILKADAPTVAAELLKAAGRDDLGGYLTAVMEKEAAAAEWAANEAKKKLRERRDAVALSLSGVARYTQQVQTTRKAIDRIIELEDGK